MVELGKDFKKRIRKTATLRSKASRSRAERGVTLVNFEVPAALDNRLEAVAKQHGLKKTDIMRDAMASAVEVLEATPAK